MKKISVKEAQEKIGSFVILDVRTPQEFSGGHIKGALNIDAFSSDFADKISQLDKNFQYLVYCNSGNRSFSSSALMDNMGFDNVFDLEGGISEWLRNGLPVEK